MTDQARNPCPSISGQLQGYQIEYLNEDKIWKVLDVDSRPGGVPYPLSDGRYLSLMGLMGYEQAMTVIWSYRANWWSDPLAARKLNASEFRLVPYTVTYSVEAFRNEDESIEMDTFNKPPIFKTAASRERSD